MADVKWIKIVTDIFDDEKMLLIDGLPEKDGIIVIWFKLLCMAGKQNNGGVLMLNDKIAYTDEMLATIFRRPLNIVRLALKTFEQFGMIEIIENTITIPNWEKHQNLDKMERVKEQGRKRVAEHRKKQKLIAGSKSNANCNVTQPLQEEPCNGDVTKSNADRLDREKELEKDREIEKDNLSFFLERCENFSTSQQSFNKPMLKEVETYAKAENIQTDVQRFYSYYEKTDWKTKSGQPITDWKSTLRYWANTDKKDADTSKKNPNDSHVDAEKAAAYKSLIYNLDE